ISGDVDYAAIARRVYLATDAARLMKEVGLEPPTETAKTFSVMGKPFDPADPEGYIASFAISRTGSMPGPERLRPLALSLAVFAAFVTVWAASTRATGGAADLDPEYAALMGAQVTQGASAMPGPGEVAAKLWSHIRDPFYDAGPNDKG